MKRFLRIPFVLCLMMVVWTHSIVFATTPPNSDSPLGTNLHTVTDWSSEYTFTDVFKASREWITQNASTWDTDEADLLDVDADGWIRSLPDTGSAADYRFVGTLMLTQLGVHYPAGQYIVLYDGEGTIEYGLDAVKNVILSTPGRDVLDVTPGATNQGIYLKITATDPNDNGNYIRNIRVLMPGYDETNYQANPFHPDFVSGIEKYKVIRFMDWMRTNLDPNAATNVQAERNPQAEMTHPLDGDVNPFLSQTIWPDAVEWSDRPETENARYSTDSGVPLEVMIDLANSVSADAWFNIPHQASDDYITQFATMVRDQLNPAQYAYIEYSNEVWNSQFGQADWVEQQAVAEWPTDPSPPLTKRLSWFGMRSAEICDIFEQVFADQSERVICVIATQAANSWIGEQMLDCPLWSGAPCHTHNIDAVAIAPYFGQHIGRQEYEPYVEAWTNDPDGGLNNLFAEIQDGDILPDIPYVTKTTVDDAINNISAYKAVANTRTIDLIAYEGGQHLVGVGSAQWNSMLTTLFGNANHDSRMGAIYANYFDAWHTTGGQIHIHYTHMGTFTQWGNWGAQEYYDDILSVKSVALATYIDLTSCDWEVCSPPSIIPTAVSTSTQSATTNSAIQMVLFALLLLVASFTMIFWKDQS